MGQYSTDANLHGDICPGNICPYKEYQCQSNDKARSRQGKDNKVIESLGKVKARSRQGQGKVKESLGKVKAKSLRRQDKVERQG